MQQADNSTYILHVISIIACRWSRVNDFNDMRRNGRSYFFPLVPVRPLSRVALLSSLVWRDACCCSSYFSNFLCTSVGWDTAVIATAPAYTTAFASFLFTMTFPFRCRRPVIPQAARQSWRASCCSKKRCWICCRCAGLPSRESKGLLCSSQLKN